MELSSLVLDKIDKNLKMYIVKNYIDLDGTEDLTKTVVMEFTVRASVEKNTILNNNDKIFVISFVGSRYRIEDAINKLLMYNSRGVEISSKIYKIMNKNIEDIRVCSKKIDELDELDDIALSMNQRIIRTVIVDLIELKQKINKDKEKIATINALLLQKVNEINDAIVINERTINSIKEAVKDYKINV